MKNWNKVKVGQWYLIEEDDYLPRTLWLALSYYFETQTKETGVNTMEITDHLHVKYKKISKGSYYFRRSMSLKNHVRKSNG